MKMFVVISWTGKKYVNWLDLNTVHSCIKTMLKLTDNSTFFHDVFALNIKEFPSRSFSDIGT